MRFAARRLVDYIYSSDRYMLFILLVLRIHITLMSLLLSLDRDRSSIARRLIPV